VEHCLLSITGFRNDPEFPVIFISQGSVSETARSLPSTHDKDKKDQTVTIYLLAILLFAIGIFGVVSQRNLIKMIIGLTIAEHAVNLFFVLIAYRRNGRAPIFSPDVPIAMMVDPLPQGLVLTAIVIGLGSTALLVALAMRLYGKYGTYDIAEIRELRG
jgi:multisubunit Na+/H+ antiporter MnhC subunit